MSIEYRDKSMAISCRGDIAVFGCELTRDGVGWVVLADGPQGRIGRKATIEEAQQLLDKQQGVMIGAKDPKSLDVIIEAFTAMRDTLVEHQGDDDD